MCCPRRLQFRVRGRSNPRDLQAAGPRARSRNHSTKGEDHFAPERNIRDGNTRPDPESAGFVVRPYALLCLWRRGGNRQPVEAISQPQRLYLSVSWLTQAVERVKGCWFRAAFSLHPAPRRRWQQGPHPQLQPDLLRRSSMISQYFSGLDGRKGCLGLSEPLHGLARQLSLKEPWLCYHHAGRLSRASTAWQGLFRRPDCRRRLRLDRA